MVFGIGWLNMKNTSLTGQQAFILANNYTNQSIEGIAGTLAGKNCTIESQTKENGVNTVVFKWTADNGDIRRTTITILDGTPIYEWQSGDSYEIGNLCLYSDVLYKCIEANEDDVFDPTKWIVIGGADGDYNIVANSEALPDTFTVTDRKMYYSIADEVFWLWDGSDWIAQQPKSFTIQQVNRIKAIFN